MIEFIVKLVVISYLASSMIASLYIGKAPGYELEQKRVQIILIWLLPFFASAFFSWFLWSDRKAQLQNNKVGNNTSISRSEAVNHGFASSEHRDR